jgi:hypothetical protein
MPAKFRIADLPGKTIKSTQLPLVRNPFGRLNDLLVGSGNKSSARVMLPYPLPLNVM